MPTSTLPTTLTILSTLLPLTSTAPTSPSNPTIAIPPTLTSFPTTITKTKWTTYSTTTEYPNPGLPLFSQEEWVDTTMAAVYEPWLSAPTAFPYTLVRISETTAMNELRVTTEWHLPATTLRLLTNSWTVRETVVIGG